MTNLILMTKLIKVICIDNDGCSKNLKLNKIYDAAVKDVFQHTVVVLNFQKTYS